MNWLRRLDDRVLGQRRIPSWQALPTLSTLQALGVIALGVVVASLLPRWHLGGGFFVDFGAPAFALLVGLAVFAPRPARPEPSCPAGPSEDDDHGPLAADTPDESTTRP